MKPAKTEKTINFNPSTTVYTPTAVGLQVIRFVTRSANNRLNYEIKATYPYFSNTALWDMR